MSYIYFKNIKVTLICSFKLIKTSSYFSFIFSIPLNQGYIPGWLAKKKLDVSNLFEAYSKDFKNRKNSLKKFFEKPFEKYEKCFLFHLIHCLALCNLQILVIFLLTVPILKFKVEVEN